MLYTKLYVGSNNTTHKLEYEKVKEVMKTAQQDYTLIFSCEGYYKGKSEACVIIEIYGNYNLAIIQELKRELKQNSIMVVRDYKDVSFE